MDAMQSERSASARVWAAFCLVLACGCAKTEAQWNRELVARSTFGNALAALALAEQAPSRSEAAIPVLLDVLDGPENAVRPHVRRALARIAPFAVRDMLHRLATAWPPSDATQAALVDALCDAGAPAVPSMLEAMHEPEVAAAPHADIILARIGAPAVEPLLSALEPESDAGLRRRAVELLGRIGPPARAAVPALVLALQGPDETCAGAAARSLARIRPDGREVLPALRAALAAPSLELRAAAGAAVAEIQIVRAAPATAQERDAAAREVVAIGKAALPALVERAGMAGAERALFARECLVRIVVANAFLSRARGGDPRRVSALIGDMTLMDRPVARGLAAIELGCIGVGAAAAMPLLVVATRDGHQGVRVAANLGLVLIVLDAVSNR